MPKAASSGAVTYDSPLGKDYTGARGGVYLADGIQSDIQDQLSASSIRRRFDRAESTRPFRFGNDGLKWVSFGGAHRYHH